MKRRKRYVALETFELPIIDEFGEPEGIGEPGSEGFKPWVVTLRSPRSDEIQALVKEHADEFSRYVADLPEDEQDGAEVPEDMQRRQGMDICQACHVKWKNAPIEDDKGKLIAASRIDFKGKKFREFLEEDPEYTLQVLKGVKEEKNYVKKADEAS